MPQERLGNTMRYLWSCTLIARNKQTGKKEIECISLYSDSNKETEVETYILSVMAPSIFPRNKYTEYETLLDLIPDEWILEAAKEIMKGR